MPNADPDASGDNMPSDQSKWQRLSGTVRDFMLKPAVAVENATGNRGPGQNEPTTVPEIQAAIKQTSDKERLIGLLVAPVAAGIAFLVTASLVANDPKSLLSNGQINPHHANPSTYLEFGLVAMALSLAMLAMAWLRKRTFLGIAAALYGLSLFNLRFWGFGVPYIMIGSWYLVRAYRLQEKFKRATAGDAGPYRPSPTMAPPSKRFTPPTVTSRRSPKPKPDKEIGAG